MDTNEELLKVLMCPSCGQHMYPPIWQCVRGHSICNQCHLMSPMKCSSPSCAAMFIGSRNISLEALAEKLQYPCINRKFGCTKALKYEELQVHQMVCTAKSYNCAREWCNWSGELRDISDHWATVHKHCRTYGAKNEMQCKMKRNSYYTSIVRFHPKHLFYYKCKTTDSTIFWAVQYIGTQERAEDFYYEIEIINPEKCKRTILLSDYCTSFDVGNNDLFEKGVCISFLIDDLNKYIGNSKVLKFWLRVLGVNERARPTQKGAVKKKANRPNNVDANSAGKAKNQRVKNSTVFKAGENPLNDKLRREQNLLDSQNSNENTKFLNKKKQELNVDNSSVEAEEIASRPRSYKQDQSHCDAMSRLNLHEKSNLDKNCTNTKKTPNFHPLKQEEQMLQQNNRNMSSESFEEGKVSFPSSYKQDYVNYKPELNNMSLNAADSWLNLIEKSRLQENRPSSSDNYKNTYRPSSSQERETQRPQTGYTGNEPVTISRYGPETQHTGFKKKPAKNNDCCLS